MRRGIAEGIARTGCNVAASEINQGLLDKGLEATGASLTKAVEKKKAIIAGKAASSRQKCSIVAILLLYELHTLVESFHISLNLFRKSLL